MKLKQWLYGAAGLAMLAGCSDRDGGLDTGGTTNHNGSGYVSIQIGMPAGNTTRGENDKFDDGLENEYKVNNLGILFFTGREEEAKFYKAYDCSKAFEPEKPEEDQITSINRVTFKVDVTETSESLWALAVVNYRSVMEISQDGEVKLVKDGSTLTSDTSIKDLLMATTTENLANPTGNGFFMTNTPYTTAPGSNDNSAPTGFVHLLAAVDKEKIKETVKDAQDNPAAEIFVERAVAKVEVTSEDLSKLTNNTLPSVKSIKWIIDNTEPETFVIRNLVNDNNDGATAPEWLAYTQTESLSGTPIPYNYRFVGNLRFNWNIPNSTNLDMYRIYFAADPHGNGIDYSKDTDSPMKILSDNDKNFATAFGEIGVGKPQYCYENTFDVEHMDYYNTTRAVLQVTFDGGEFYTRGIDRKTKYEFKDAAATIAHFVIENSVAVGAWTNYFQTAETAPTISIADLTFDPNLTGTTKRAFNNWVSLEYKVRNGRLLLDKVTLYDGQGQEATNIVTLTDQQEADLKASVNAQVTFNAYVGGTAYYAVRIKHFGDELTPWVAPIGNDNNPKPTPDTETSYGGIDDNANKNYLGRYGVLRNNWYQVHITEISKFGEPTVGDLVLDNTPDDKNELEQAIACKINILSWAKRYQSEKF